MNSSREEVKQDPEAAADVVTMEHMSTLPGMHVLHAAFITELLSTSQPIVSDTTNSSRPTQQTCHTRRAQTVG